MFQQGVREVKEFKSMVVDQWDLDAAAVRMVCEHPSLSLPVFGQPFFAVDLTMITGSGLAEIDPGDFDYMLDVSAALLDIEHTEANGPAAGRLKWQIQEEDGYKEGRKLLRKAMAAPKAAARP